MMTQGEYDEMEVLKHLATDVEGHSISAIPGYS
jgi:hypothetical protein